MGIRARVEIDDSLTFGDLYEFVDLARASDIDPEAKVVQVPASEQDPGLGVGAHELEAARTATFDPRFTFSGDDVQAWSDALDRVIEEEGDARGVLDELTQLRDRLVGREAGSAPCAAHLRSRHSLPSPSRRHAYQLGKDPRIRCT